MENVKVKEEAGKSIAKKAVKKEKSNPAMVKFMEDRNMKRKAAKLKPAYSEDQIKAYK